MIPLVLNFIPGIHQGGPDSLFSASVQPVTETTASLLPDPVKVVTAIIILIILSAMIRAAGVACSILCRAENAKVTSGDKYRKLRNLLENPGQWHSTVTAVTLFLNVSIVILAFRLAQTTLLNENPSTGSYILTGAVIALIILIFTEVIPVLAARKIPLTTASFMALPISIARKLFSPATLALQHAGETAAKISRKKQKNISVDEISQALELNTRDDTPEEKEILRGIVNFGNKTADEIMVPRVDVIAIDIKSSFTDVLELINNSGYSRIPVYSGSFDYVRGILYIKDLLPYTEKGEDFHWSKLLRPPFFVPETKKVKDLLEEFQKNKIHLAIVVDEYGGSSGIVTLEDVLEEIVGEIADEFDEEEHYFTRLGDEKYLFDGKIPLEQFCETVGCELDAFDQVRGDADTLAGLILEIKGDIPASQEKIEFNNIRFTIESVTNRRIRQIRTELF